MSLTINGKEWKDEHEWHDSIVSPEVKTAIDAMVPWEWQHVICGCYSGEGSRYKNDDGTPRPCDRCGKVRRIWFARCGECKQWYITYTFQHSKKHEKFVYDPFTRKKFRGACWNCLVGYYGRSESDVPPPDWAAPREARSLDDLFVEINNEIDEDLFKF